MALQQDSDTKRDFQVYSFLWERREREGERQRERDRRDRERDKDEKGEID